ncbi:MAG: hypothetical protein A3K19_25840 [Lentisphaerae bacterium RIFOXYB12_FULL_65_16]|nr:MAG: hypothetical protein A3K18_31840 [Lentisphaerae bacterium RIFOXYA12_64_32]OGV91393.1 MAG: hypothetical protein A3K19_25840 [Lentisphaerae bacterium RIFOXYB12_FULL_65_16]
MSESNQPAREKVYIETSVVSYLCARPSRDLIVAANQEMTHEWWETRRQRYDLFVSEFVHAEIADGDPDAARKRQETVAGIAVLAASDAALDLALEISRQAGLPASVADDVAHIAVATAHGMDYVLTWNCAHIANPHWQTRIARVIRGAGYLMPVMCTPQAMLEGE